MHTDLEDSTGYQSTSSSRDPIWTRVSSDPAGDLIGSHRSSNVRRFQLFFLDSHIMIK